MDFNAEPYWDDFAATNGAKEQNYVRILFRPGYAVQARELTQVQSILQNQIKQFGDHIFQDGSPVMGGHISLRTDVTYININKQYGGTDVDLDNFYGLVVYNQSYPQTRAKVIQTYSTDATSTLLVRVIAGPGFAAGETIQAGTSYATILNSSYTGTGSVAEINSGVFYIDGYFVQIAGQSIVLDAYSTTPTFKVGLEIHDSVVTESDDAALLDPAQESFNYQAPGAHRYQHTLVLAKRALDSVDDSKFFELLRVEAGAVTKQISYPIYSELEKTLARRTYDESGDYAVRPFIADVSANTPAGTSENTSTFLVNVHPGKAYIKGMEFETVGTNKLSVNRARTTKQSSGFNLSGYYGNRVLVSNVSVSNARSILMSESLVDVDIHCVANNLVDLTSGRSDKYYATRVGTGKIRNFDRPGSDANTYYMYLTETNFDPILTTANGNSVNASSVNLRSEFSSTANAYQNAIITLVNTSGASGNTATVIDYNPTTKVAVVTPAFLYAPAAGDQITITMGASDVESFIVANTSTFTSANLQANVSVFGRDATGNTLIEDSAWDSDLFTLPSYYIKHGSDKSVQLYRRYILSGAGFSGNGAYTVTLPTSHAFDFGSPGQLVSSADIKENIIVVANNGTIVDMTQSPRSALLGSSSQLTLYTNSVAGAAFLGDIYLTTKVTNANGSLRRTKTKTVANSGLTQYDKPSIGTTAVTNYGSVLINASNGIVWFTNANSIVTNWNEKMPLYVADVIKIKGIYDSGNIAFAPNTQNATTISISNRYLLDSGQNDNFYDYSSLRLKPGAPPPTGQVAVVFDRYTHSGQGYISANSYDYTSDYLAETIPVYKNALGQYTYLRDAIDLRPIRTIGTSGDPYIRIPLTANVNVSSGGVIVTANLSKTTGNTLAPPITVGSIIKIGNDQRTVNAVINTAAVKVSVPFSASATDSIIYSVTQNTALTGSIIQRPTDPIVTDYEFYLPRIDKLVVTKDKSFKVLQGIPNQHPVEPSENPETEMPIYKITVPPFTSSLKSVVLEYIENRRYTMKDIAGLEDRIQRIESYVNLKDAESKLINDPPTSAKNPAIVKPIYGFLVDDFADLSIADQTTGGFASSIQDGVLSCYKIINSLPLQISNINDAAVRDKFITIPYTEVTFVSQPLATLDGPEQVMPDTLSGDFNNAYVTITPESDYWYSTRQQPTYSDTTASTTTVVQDTTSDPSQIVSTANTIGSNSYSSNTTTVIVGSGTEVSTCTVVTVATTNGNPANTEANTTTTLNIDFTGINLDAALAAAYVSAMGGSGAYNLYQYYIDPTLFASGAWSAQLSTYYGRLGW